MLEQGAEVAVFLLQGLQAGLPGLEFGSQLQLLVGAGLQGLLGPGLGCTRVFENMLQGLLPVFGAGVVAQ